MDPNLPDYNNSASPFPSTETIDYTGVGQPKRSNAPAVILIVVVVLLLLCCCCIVFPLLMYFVLGDVITDAMGITSILQPAMIAASI